MQGNLHWNAPAGTLGRLVEAAWTRAGAMSARRREFRARALDAAPAPSFLERLQGTDVAVIAELKRRSPSKGAIRPDMDVVGQAMAYSSGGASALSVLTEPTEFGGSVEDLSRAVAATQLPALSKDFHVDAVQLFEARAHGAAAALLIVRALNSDRMAQLVDAARAVGLEMLIEVRDERELERALEVQDAAIGVNSRDLESLAIDATTVGRIVPSIPRHRIAIAESGVTDVEGVHRAAAAGADAVLVGSSLSASSDPAGAVRALTRVPRIARGA